MLLNTADKVYAGTLLADAVYLGDTKVWPTEPQDPIAAIPGLMGGLYALDEQLGTNYTSNLGTVLTPRYPGIEFKAWAGYQSSKVRVQDVAGVRAYSPIPGSSGSPINTFIRMTAGTTGMRYIAGLFRSRATGSIYGPWGIGNTTSISDLSATQLRHTSFTATRQAVAAPAAGYYGAIWAVWEAWHDGTRGYVAIDGNTYINIAGAYALKPIPVLMDGAGDAGGFHMAAVIAWNRALDGTERAIVRDHLSGLMP